MPSLQWNEDMPQEVSLRSGPPDGALVVVESELDEGVALAEVDPVQPGVQFNRHLEFKARVKAQVKSEVKDPFRARFRDAFSGCVLRRGLRRWLTQSVNVYSIAPLNSISASSSECCFVRFLVGVMCSHLEVWGRYKGQILQNLKTFAPYPWLDGNIQGYAKRLRPRCMNFAGKLRQKW